ncbi:putative phosphoglycerate mutase [Salana multivorans]|uniref:Putative phosphoglycerate mutase n=1 Tax=Salana multivorans TaxID=120377 RepID=A0A3N2DAH6_9MICO|nr:histidine phosphatase family protein [Salana multivorans]ROR96787.1 putative phosphoglycerate mutase [Salana multivorans]
MRLYLVRHGQTHSNVGSLLDTAVPGAELTDLGRLQARALVPALGSSGIEAIHVSTLRRTHATAAPLVSALGLTPEVQDGLREISAGSMEMQGDEVSVLRYLEVAGAWLDGELGVRMPGGESGEEVFERFDAAVERLAGTGVETAAAVSHGAIIRVWAGVRSVGILDGMAARRPLPNTGGVLLEGEPGDWRLVSWHDEPFGVAHLDAVAPEAVEETVEDDESPAAEPFPED